MNRVLLAIETSCDETSASVISNGVIKSNIVSSQVIHEKYGGVFPEVASREHMKYITKVAGEALIEANIAITDLDGIAFTQGPGLLGALLVGTSFAKALAYSMDLPLIAIDHMKAHIFANFIEEPKPKFPFLCLTVSGGHTQISLVKDYFDIEVLGKTQDDALGEAFDKIGKILGLKYPAGPLIDKYAHEGDPHKYQFPDTKMQGFDYSFSGIKTAFLNFIRKNTIHNEDFINQNIYDICASIQQKLIDMALQKFRKAIKHTGVNNIALAGGVSCNSLLRSEAQKMTKKLNLNLYIPSREYCTDNAAMIAQYADFQFKSGMFINFDVVPSPRMY